MKLLGSLLTLAIGQRRSSERCRIHSSFRDIVDEYDAFILDQFGVLHNGVHSLDGAVELVRFLSKQNKKLIILSNTSAPAHKALEKLPKFGFDSQCFLDAVTSGEEASKFLQSYPPSKALFWTWNIDIPNNPRVTAPPQDFLDQCGGHIELADSVDEADLLLLHGAEVWQRPSGSVSLGNFIETGDCATTTRMLEEIAERNLPMVCANPDHTVVTPSGGKAYMPGRIASQYTKMTDADCHFFGKPDPSHFLACLEKLQSDRVAHVGDSLSHDIAGANVAGIDSVFVTSGIHAEALGTTFGEMPEEKRLWQLFESEQAYPTHVVSTFS